MSRQWWERRSSNHDLFLSEEVVRERSHASYPRSVDALALVRGIPALDADRSVYSFARVLVDEMVMPAPAEEGDAVHVALCCVHGVDVLLSWNVRHLANFNKMLHLRWVCARAGYGSPTILTPESDIGGPP